MPEPKVLIVSSWAPPSPGGSPQSLYNLLRQFPPGSFAILTALAPIRARAGSVGSWLDCDYYFYDHATLQPDKQTDLEVRISDTKRDVKWAARAWTWLIQSPRLAGLRLAIPIPSQVIRMTRKALALDHEFRPTVVLGLSDYGLGLIAAATISHILGIPLVYLILDIYKGNKLGWPLALIARLAEKPLLSRARIIAVNNEGTRDFYAARYPDLADRLAIVRNVVDSKPYAGLRTPYIPMAPYSIVFSGSIYWAQEQSIRNLLAAMLFLRDIPIQLRLYVVTPPRWLFSAIASLANVTLQSASADQMPAIQTKADILFLPLSWVDSGRDIIATATPGKLADYLQAGRPILVHAPPYAYISNYARQQGFAEVVDQDSPEALADGIRRILNNPVRSQAMVEQALITAERDCSPAQNSATLMTSLGFRSC